MVQSPRRNQTRTKRSRGRGQDQCWVLQHCRYQRLACRGYVVGSSILTPHEAALSFLHWDSCSEQAFNGSGLGRTIVCCYIKITQNKIFTHGRETSGWNLDVWLNYPFKMWASLARPWEETSLSKVSLSLCVIEKWDQRELGQLFSRSVDGL